MSNSSIFPAMLGPIMVLIVGILIALFILNLSWVDAMYYAVVTMTTVGVCSLSYL
ncbi:hypothetical protein T492DRAFT_893887 [Pavlovales sp. CCMP2436]|nr:hypothetical protein T492DRAFT_893887 [Pavlovales sp. CCMP2436]